jgi:hypothetical protein
MFVASVPISWKLAIVVAINVFKASQLMTLRYTIHTYNSSPVGSANWATICLKMITEVGGNGCLHRQLAGEVPNTDN